MKEHPQLFANPDGEGVIKIITDSEKIKTLQNKLKKEYEDSGKKAEWIDIGVLSEDSWFWVVRDLVEFPDGKIGGYLRILNRKTLDGGTNVVIMAMQDKKILLLKHFRHETRNWHWEFPRGFGEPGLSPEQSVMDELKEETNLLPQKLIKIGKITDVDGETIFYFAELENGEPSKPTGEAIQHIELIKLDELENWIFTGKITDWFTIMAFMMYKNQRH